METFNEDLKEILRIARLRIPALIATGDNDPQLRANIGVEMLKSQDQFKAEHKAFRARLRSIHSGPIGVAARDAMLALREAYKAAALEHWAEMGNCASTGWGETPEGEYQTAQSPERCAKSLANTLAHYFSQDPPSPPGTRSKEAS